MEEEEKILASKDSGQLACHTKIGPPLKLVRPDKFWQKSLPKLVPCTSFAAKIGPAGPILVAKLVPPCQNRSPAKLSVLSIMHSWMYYD